MEKPGQYAKQQVDASSTIHLQCLCKPHFRGTSGQAGDTVSGILKPVTKPGGLQIGGDSLSACSPYIRQLCNLDLAGRALWIEANPAAEATGRRYIPHTTPTNRP